jgi:hypothetical protein
MEKKMPDPIKPNAENNAAPAAAPAVEPPASAPAAQPSPEEKSRVQARIDQITAARKAAEERARLAEERLAQIELEKRASAIPPGSGVRPGQKTEMVGQMSREEWNEWHNEDPAAAIEYLADIKADAKAKQVVSQMEQATQVERTIGEVYKAHPELREVMNGEKAPEEVPFWQVYDEVAREMPDARFLAKGPLIVMKEAERRMKERELSEKEKQIAANAAAEEANRQTRVGASHTLGAKVSPPASGSVKLTDEELLVARKMRMSPEEYAKFKA